MSTWTEIVESFGGNAQTCQHLGMSPTTLQRVKRGAAPVPEASLPALVMWCVTHDLTLPVPPRHTDLEPLESLAACLAMGFPPRKGEVVGLLDLYPMYQLIELAENDDTPPDILSAVTHLLEQE
jgi:hypothetical protein